MDERTASGGTAPGFVLLGLAGAARDGARAVAGAAAGAGRTVAQPVVTTAWGLVPPAARATAAQALQALDARGRVEAEHATATAQELTDALADRLGTHPSVLRVVQDVVDQVQWRVVDDVLPAVLQRLAAEPDDVRAIVQGQSQGMVEDIARSARSRAAAGDDAVERFVGRLRRHPARPDAPPSVLGGGVGVRPVAAGP